MMIHSLKIFLFLALVGCASERLPTPQPAAVSPDQIFEEFSALPTDRKLTLAAQVSHLTFGQIYELLAPALNSAAIDQRSGQLADLRTAMLALAGRYPSYGSFLTAYSIDINQISRAQYLAANGVASPHPIGLALVGKKSVKMQKGFVYSDFCSGFQAMLRSFGVTAPNLILAMNRARTNPLMTYLIPAAKTALYARHDADGTTISTVDGPSLLPPAYADECVSDGYLVDPQLNLKTVYSHSIDGYDADDEGSESGDDASFHSATSQPEGIALVAGQGH